MSFWRISGPCPSGYPRKVAHVLVTGSSSTHRQSPANGSCQMRAPTKQAGTSPMRRSATSPMLSMVAHKAFQTIRFTERIVRARSAVASTR